MFNRSQAPARLLAATIVGAVLFAAVPADAQDAHGVIAFGETPEGKGVAYGFSWNFHGKDAAHAEAEIAPLSTQKWTPSRSLSRKTMVVKLTPLCLFPS